MAAQYAALGAYVGAYALIFVPLLWIADRYFPGVISTAEQGPRWYEIPLTHKTSFVISLVVAVVLTLVVLAVQCLSPP